jgi:ribosomal protein L11 methyltransferase
LQTGGIRIVLKRIPRENWAESWKAHFHPLRIGSELLVRPSWRKVRFSKARADVILDPGLSFGTGHHATTLFCLQQLVTCRRKGKKSVLDIGTGSGILAIAAAKLGFSPVHAFDSDPDAVRIAGENAVRNRVEKDLRIWQADLACLPCRSARRYDLICANLIQNLLLLQSKRILNRLEAGGELVLAGVLTRQFSEIREHYERAGLCLVRTRRQKEWQSGVFGWKSSNSPIF